MTILPLAHCIPDRLITLDELQHAHGKWAAATFPTQTPASIVAHLAEEVTELTAKHDPIEAADCLLLLLSHAYFHGYSLFNAALHKLAVNRARTWGPPDQNGVVHHSQHIPISPPLSTCVPDTSTTKTKEQPQHATVTLSARMRAWRSENSLTLAQAAHALGTHKTQWSRWERGTVWPDPAWRNRIEDLLSGHQDPNPLHPFARALIGYRHYWAVSQKEASGRFGVNERSWRRWERGERLPYRKLRGKLWRLVDSKTPPYSPADLAA
jgi:DNA-binding transcriptional regulator YiaG